MTYDQFYRTCLKRGIPLADIKTVIEGVFKNSFDRIAIIGDQKIEYNTDEVIKKLEEGYPANYLAGYIDILDMHIFLNEDTLIPRNETAFLLKDYVSHLNLNGKKVLDLCTGSGFIALYIKKVFKDSKVIGSDISESALNCAKRSMEYNDLKVDFIKSNFLSDIEDTFDFIICNPPYIKEDSKDVDAPFEPPLALFSGKDGLDSYRAIFMQLKSHLKKGGFAIFEIETSNRDNLLKLVDDTFTGRAKYTLIKDCYQRDRFIKLSFD